MIGLIILVIVCSITYSIEIVFGLGGTILMLPLLTWYFDAKTLVIHPASTTHHRMDAEALEAAGISEGLVRMSVGIEDIDDLIDDVAIGLKASQRS